MRIRGNTGLAIFYQSAKQLLFPGRCLGCASLLPYPAEQPGFQLCCACQSALKLHRRPFCSCCGKPFPASSDPDHLCGGCLIRKKYFDNARALVLYAEPAITLVHSFKYHGATACLETFATLFSNQPCHELANNIDLIVPVPLHRKRLRQRGFNQAQVLARTFFPTARKKIDTSMLSRERDTLSQAGLSGAERRRNLKNAFRLTDPGKAEGKRVILVDDVYTTGSTVDECSRILKGAGAQKVHVLTLARVID